MGLKTEPVLEKSPFKRHKQGDQEWTFLGELALLTIFGYFSLDFQRFLQQNNKKRNTKKYF